MNRASGMDGLLLFDRLIVLSGLIVITLAGWAYMAHEARGMVNTGICQCLGMKMSGPDATSWAPSRLFPLFLMWSEMMVAMMTPSAAPMILIFASVNRKRRETNRPFVRTAFFVSGYFAAWTLFSAAAAIAQWLMHGFALLSPMMVGTSSRLGGALLILAGGFQWTPLKQSCLVHCRSPLNFIMTAWREGRTGAFLMGVRHGIHCTGCCWFLMILLFVAGVMNLWWIALISAIVLLEKIAPRGLAIAKAAGIVGILFGLRMFFA
jgi:predicted metal-binding membrane protein